MRIHSWPLSPHTLATLCKVPESTQEDCPHLQSAWSWIYRDFFKCYKSNIEDAHNLFAFPTTGHTITLCKYFIYQYNNLLMILTFNSQNESVLDLDLVKLPI